MEYINLDSSNKDTILELFSKDIDKEGFIIEKKTGLQITCPYTKEKIHVSNFSILPGSATFVNNEFFCYAEHIAIKRKDHK